VPYKVSNNNVALIVQGEFLVCSCPKMSSCYLILLLCRTINPNEALAKFHSYYTRVFHRELCLFKFWLEAIQPRLGQKNKDT
jgi:hypothetical protein